jgi:hypothetical protein
VDVAALGQNAYEVGAGLGHGRSSTGVEGAVI